MRERIHIELCTTPAQVEEAFAFLRQQNHEPVPWALPIRIVRRGQVVIGVTQEHPVLLTCWSVDKDTCSPRDISEGTNAVRLLMEGTSKHGAVYAASLESAPMFSAMEKLGFEKTGLYLFVSTPIDCVKEAK